MIAEQFRTDNLKNTETVSTKEQLKKEGHRKEVLRRWCVRTDGLPGHSKPWEIKTKRTLCSFWQRGWCNRGALCGFAHGDHETGSAVPR